MMHDDTLGTAADPSPITVMVVDDAPAVVEALVAVFDADPRFVVVGVAGAPDEVEGPAAARPHLATVDVRMPGGGGFEAARRIHTVSPDTVIVALSAFSTPSLRRRMAEAGAVAYLTKGMAGDDLLDQLAEIAAARTG